MAFDFEHEKVCPNQESHDRSFQAERERSMHAEKLLWEALSPVSCPHCNSKETAMYDRPSIADPCGLMVWGCKACGANFSDFPPRMVYAESIR